MKRKQCVIRILLLLISFCGAITLFSNEVNALSNSYKKIKNGSCYLESGETYEIPFSTTKKAIFVVDIGIDDCNYPTKGGLQVILKKGSSDKKIQNDKLSLKDQPAFYYWLVSDGYFQKPGNYTYYLKNTSDENWKIKYKIVSYSSVAKKASMKKKASGERGTWIKIGKVGPGYPGWKKSIKSISFSNQKIVKYYDNAYDGNIYIMGKNRGTTNVTLRLASGKKYTTKVTFKPSDDFSFFADLYDYNSRNNYVRVRVKNNGPRTITFVRSGAKIRNDDYKFYDRSIKSSSTVSVKPGKTKYIKFYVKGDYLWDEWENYALVSKIKYDGMTFNWRVRSGSTKYKRGKSWYNTYYDRFDYDEWYY